MSSRRARPSGHVSSLAALCLGAVLASGALAGCGSSGASKGAYPASLSAAVASATKVATDMMTWDYRSIEAHFTQLKAEGTANFADGLAAQESDTVALDQKGQFVSTGTVIAAAAEPEAKDGSITVLLFMDQRLRAVTSKNGLLSQQRAQMRMVNSGGKWIPDSVAVSGQ